MRLRQWDFSEQRRFPGTKSYYDSCKCTRKQINFRAVYWRIQGGPEWRCADSAECGAAGLMWQIKASTNDFLTLIYKYSKKRPGLVCPGRKCFRGTTCIQSLALHFVSTDILCSCNVELTLKPTWHVCLDLWIIRLDMRFGSLLGGYFHNSFTKARTDRFLSVLPGVVYSSLSWHLADIVIFIVRTGWTNVFLGYIIHL